MEYLVNKERLMQLGDFVAADLVNGVRLKRGVFVRDNEDGTIEVQSQASTGYAELYRCKKENAVVILDRNLEGALRIFVLKVRDMYGF